MENELAAAKIGKRQREGNFRGKFNRFYAETSTNQPMRWYKWLKPGKKGRKTARAIKFPFGGRAKTLIPNPSRRTGQG